jgi:4'-phosphopantetheinyl transferase
MSTDGPGPSDRFELVVLRHAHASDRCLPGLGPSDRARLASADPMARLRLLAGREAALEAAARLLGRSERESAPPLSIDATCPACGGAHGRPLVSGGARRVHVSIAHAADRAFAVAAFAPIGIDAEPHDTPRDRLAAVGELTGRRRLDPLGAWTRIEAVLKADGRGLRVDPGEVVLRRRRAGVRDRDARYGMRVLRDVEGCTVAVAWALSRGAEAVAVPGGPATRRRARPVRHP